MTYNLIRGDKHFSFYLLALSFPLYKHVILCLLKSRLHCDAVLKVKFFSGSKIITHVINCPSIWLHSVTCHKFFLCFWKCNRVVNYTPTAVEEPDWEINHI